MPPPKSNKKLDAPAEGDPQALGRAGGRISATLVVREAGQGRDPHRPERRRRAGAAPARGGRAEALARGRPPHLDPPAVFRPDRPAADARGGQGVRRATASPDAYERLVDRLLASPHYGERMAIGWLDVVRFADTIGYHSDNPRNVWPYRDWVIKSFNDNKPFDRFTLEQLAGDLLPDASTETRVGSAFNRLLLTTEEGGAQAKDYEARMLTDRVRAVGAAWLGPDHRLRPVPRPQVRPVHDARLLLARRLLRRHRGADHRPPRGRAWSSPRPRTQKTLARLDAARRRGEEASRGRRPRSLTPPRRSGRRTCPATRSPSPSSRRDSRATPAEKSAARAVQAALKKDAAARDPKEREAVQTYFRTKATPLFPAERDAVARAERERQDVRRRPAEVPGERPAARAKRTVRILPRGNWMNETGEVVKPALPHFLPRPEVDRAAT